jgi:hypothetical protein
MNKNINNKPLKGGAALQTLTNYDPGLQATEIASNNLNKATGTALQQSNTVVSNATSHANNLTPNVNSDSELENVFKDVIGSAVEIGSIATTLEVEALGTEAVVATEAVAKAAAKAAEAATKAAAEATTKVSNTIVTVAPQVKAGIVKMTDVWNDLTKVFQDAAAKSDINAFEISEKADQIQRQILLDEGLSFEQANAKLENLKKNKEVEAKAETKAEVDIAAAAAAAATAVKIAEIAAEAKQNGGSRKKLTLGQIQKGGRQSAKRTKKSINDFFNSSVTSSQILKRFLKLDENHKRKTKIKVKRRNGKKSRKGQ